MKMNRLSTGKSVKWEGNTVGYYLGDPQPKKIAKKKNVAKIAKL